MIELKPCPFCGGGNTELVCDIETLMWRIECVNCESSSGDYNTRIEAVRAWNRRA